MRRGEAGSVTLWLVVMTVAMIAAIGLVFDGGQAMATKGRAISDAFGAAHAGVEALDQSSFAGGSTPTPDPAAAVAAARSFLAQAGVGAGQSTVTVNGPEVDVTVRLSSPATILSSVGAGPFTVTGQGRARSTYGVRGPRP